MELKKISEWFKGNKLNIKKTNYTLFPRNSTKDDQHLKIFCKSILKKKASIKFLGVMLDENIS